MTDDSNGSSWKDPAIWGRAVFTLLYLLVLALVVGPLAIILGIAQAIFTIAGGEDNRNLRDLGAALARYVHEILLFASWNQEQKPFPFSEFPQVERSADAEADTGVVAEEKETVAAAKSAEASTEIVAAEESVAEGAPAEAAESEAPAKKRTRKKASARKATAEDSQQQD